MRNPWRFAEQSSLPDTYQMRFALEGFVARMAALAISDTDIAWFEQNIDAMHGALASNELDEAAQLDFDFHMRLVSIAGNAAIESILRSSSDIMKESQRMPFYQARTGFVHVPRASRDSRCTQVARLALPRARRSRRTSRTLRNAQACISRRRRHSRETVPRRA